MKLDTSVAESEYENIENPFENFSFFNYLCGETNTPEIERESSIYKNRKKRIYTFLSIPKNLESFLIYALIICVDHFLWLYTFLPVKCILLPLKVSKRLISVTRETLLRNEEVEDFVKFSFLVICTSIMCHVDISVIYHQIRSQSVIKLYIFFNILEVADRLLSPLSQDIMDALSWTISKSEKRRTHFWNFICQYVFATFCFLIHIMVMLSQTTVLNVAFNSHNSALLIIMLSNNFIEIKGNVFRKAEKSNLFQMSCADSRERFHYIIMLGLIVFRNLRETGWSTDEVMSMFKLCSAILFSEIVVDWIKHAFVTKFNFITAEVYKEFSVTLAYDILLCQMGKNLCSYFELMSRRMVLTSIPLGCLVNIFLLGWLRACVSKRWILLLFFLVGCFLFKVLINLLLLKLSYKMVNAYLIAAHSSQHMESMNDHEKENSISDTYSKQNDYEIILPPLLCGKYKTTNVLKRNASFSEGFQLTNEEEDTSTKYRLGRSSLVLIDTHNQNIEIGDVNDISSSDDAPNDDLIQESHPLTNMPEDIVTLSSRYGYNTEEMSNMRSEKENCIIRKRGRTISSLTEDLSEASTEPLIILSEEATGITSDINDGSKGLLVNTNCNSIKSEEIVSRELKEDI